MSDYELVHYFATMNGDAIRVDDCAAAQSVADENEWRDGVWWIEIRYYDTNGEAVAGGEWPCGCPESAP